MIELKTLTRKPKLRAAVSDMSLSDIDKIIRDLVAIRKDMAESKTKGGQMSEARREKVMVIREKMKAYGITDEDLVVAQKTKRRVAPKYRLGTTTWTGRGRTPRVIQEFLNQGGSMEQLLIASPNPAPMAA